LKKTLLFIVIIIASGALWGCERKPAAVVNGDPITEETLQRKLQENISQHGEEGAKVDPASLRKAVLDQLISETLLLQGALEAGITIPEEDVNIRMQAIRARSGEESFKNDLKGLGITEEAFVSMLRERMLKERFVETLLDDEPVTDDQIKEYYKNSPKPFIRPAEVNIRFIQFSDQGVAEAAMQTIKEKKETFDAMASRMDKSGEAIVSEYSWISPTVFGSNISNVLKTMKAGSVEGPIAGGGGIYIFRLKESRPEKIKSFDEAKEDIRHILRNEKRASVVIHWIAAKRKESMVTIN